MSGVFLTLNAGSSSPEFAVFVPARDKEIS